MQRSDASLFTFQPRDFSFIHEKAVCLEPDELVVVLLNTNSQLHTWNTCCETLSPNPADELRIAVYNESNKTIKCHPDITLFQLLLCPYVEY